jgi:hypothetical protein
VRPVSDGVSVFAFRMWRRGADSGQWVPGARLLVHLDDGGGGVPAQLSWVTEDGAQCALGFSPDMAGCYGHRRTAGGDVAEVRGELDDPRDGPGDGEGAGGYEFGTQVQDAGGWLPAGRLRVLAGDGGEAPARWVAWHDRSGNACSVALCAAGPSGSADVSGLVTAVRASAEHRGAGEVAANLVDASGSKWFAPRNRASLEFRLARPVPVNRYVLVSANDAPDRDPAAWTLRGSADGRLWRALDARTGQSFPGRHQSRMYRIAGPGAYERYRLDITGSNGSPHLQLQAVRFLADSGGFVGYRQLAGHAPIAYRGIRVMQASQDIPAPLPEDASAPSKSSTPISTSGFQPSPSPSPSATPAAGSTEPPLALEGRDGDGPNPRNLTIISDPALLAYGGCRLGRGEFLRNQSLTSASGRCTLQNAFKVTTLYDNATGEALWVAPIRHDYGAESSFALGLDGDLTVWNRYRVALWNSGTAGRGVESLEVRDNGEVVLLDGAGGTVWTTGTRVGPALWPDDWPSPGRGAVLRRGQSLRRQSLTSDDGSTVLFHYDRGVQLRDRGGQMSWSVAIRADGTDGTYLALDEDGMLRIRAGGGSMLELAGPGQELVVVRDRAQLRDAAGSAVWTTARGGLPDAMPLGPPGPAQSRLEVWIDSLTAGRGYSAAVVLDVEPAEALRRRGLPDSAVSRSTWERRWADTPWCSRTSRGCRAGRCPRPQWR